MKTARNDPCPCGSGKKYKHCHLGTSLEDTVDEEGVVIRRGPARWPLFAVAVIVGVLIGLWRGPDSGIIVTIGGFLVAGIYASVSRPPAPKENPGNPAALDFGNARSDRGGRRRG